MNLASNQSFSYLRRNSKRLSRAQKPLVKQDLVQESLRLSHQLSTVYDALSATLGTLACTDICGAPMKAPLPVESVGLEQVEELVRPIIPSFVCPLTTLQLGQQQSVSIWYKQEVHSNSVPRYPRSLVSTDLHEDQSGSLVVDCVYVVYVVYVGR